nr:MAG TPA: hypothetical protein [Caudoviricetes sp.]
MFSCVFFYLSSLQKYCGSDKIVINSSNNSFTNNLHKI